MRARDVMSQQVVTVRAEATLREALAAMEEAGLSKLPVLAEGRVLGIMTAHSLRLALRHGGDALSSPVADLVEPEPAFVDPDLPLVQVLIELQAEPALLVGERGRLLGIITARDVARVAGPWLLVMEVEHALRALIERRLQGLSGPWWEQRLPEPVARAWAHERFEPEEAELPEGVRHLAHATWWQYEAIIEHNWEPAFAAVFRRREEALGHLTAVHAARNRLAHGQALTPEQEVALRLGASYLLKRM